MRRSIIFAILIPIIIATISCKSDASSLPPIETAVNVATSPKIFIVTPENVKEMLKEIVPLKVKEFRPQDLYYFAGRDEARGVIWATAEFDPDDSGCGWTLGQIEFALKPIGTDGVKTYDALYQALEKRLGKPSWTDNNPIGWEVGNKKNILLGEGKFRNQFEKGMTKVVTLTVSVPQGESEEE